MNIYRDDAAVMPNEQLRIRAKCFHPSGSFEEFKKGEIEKSIPERFEQQVQTNPDRLAIKTSRYELTYDMLNRWSNRIANAILGRCGEGQEPIFLVFERDAPVIAAMLAVLKAGKFYISLDSSHPREKIADIIADSQASIILTDCKNFTLAQKMLKRKTQVLNVNELNSTHYVGNPGLSIRPNAFAYIIYTSGSTGRPKGVIYNHRNVLHFTMTYTNERHVCREDRLSFLAPVSFVASTSEIYPALLNGASLFPYDIKNIGVKNLANLFIRDKITICILVPTVFRALIDTLNGDENLHHLRFLKIGADRVEKNDIELYKKHFPTDCVLCVGYGTTESRTVSEIYFSKESEIIGSIVPVGYAAPDKNILLLNENGQEIGFNQIGEIVVKSRYLSPGYLRRPDLTKLKFKPDPNDGKERFYYTGDLGRMAPDGCLYHLGRKDFQVKIRGFRVELAEIETALLKHEDIKETLVTARKNRHGETRLVAYLVTAGQSVPTVTELWRLLDEKLPDYMIPSTWVFLDAIPLLPNGKVNRPALPKPGNDRPNLEDAFVPPLTHVEQSLVKIWSEALDIEPVGIHDKFLELGGNSLLAIQIISRVLNKYQVKLSLPSLLAAPTIAEMAVLITQNQAEKVNQEELDMMLADLE